jgi:hypothetical protein
MAESEAVPRSLRISFEFEVPRTLKGVNIRHTGYQKAMDTIADRVIGMSEGLFPWASQVIVRKQWVYNWIDNTKTITLPETDANTPK